MTFGLFIQGIVFFFLFCYFLALVPKVYPDKAKKTMSWLSAICFIIWIASVIAWGYFFGTDVFG